MTQSLLIDIGNSTTVFATVNKASTSYLDTCSTKELSSYLDSLSTEFDRVIVSSVVPECNDLINNRYKHAYFVTSETIPFLSIDVSNPEQVGGDRLVTALAASVIYQQECLIVDSGTAITFERVSTSSTYLGGLIFPGMHIASQSLHDYTAQIPLIWVEPTDQLLGGSTQEAVSSGLYHGYISMINGLIRKFRGEVPGLVVIGAGNGLSVFNDQLDIDYYHTDLQLKGLGIVWEHLNEND